MGLGTLLGAIAVGLLVAVAVAVAQALLGNALPDRAVTLLDRILLILMMIELLYAVQNERAFQGAMLELGLLTVMIVALVVSLVILRNRPPHGVAELA